MLRTVLPLAAVLAFAAAVPSLALADDTVSVGACVMGICTSIPPTDVPGVTPILGCQHVGTPPVPPVLGPDAVLVIVCA